MSPTVKSLILTTALLGTAALCSAQIPTDTSSQSAPPAETTASHPQDRMVSMQTIRDNVSLARNAFKDIHPGYSRFTDAATLDAAWNSILERSDRENGLSVGDFYLELSGVLALIRCDHTKAELNASMKAARKTSPLYLPLRWTVVEGRAVVLTAPDGNPIAAGDEILSIDGRTVGELRDALHRYIPIDGYNEHTRDGQMSASLEFMGGAVDHFGALLWDVPATAVLEVQSADGARRTISLDRVGHDDWSSIAIDQGARNFRDAVTLTRVGERSAVLSVDTFINYRQPVDPDTIYGPVFETLRAEGRDQLVLDLRRNGGGSTDASQGLFAYFIDAPRKMKNAQIMKTLNHRAYEDYINTWDKRAINPNRLGFKKTADGEYALRGAFTEDTDTIKPAKAAFQGDLTILTSRDNSSGSTNLISALRHARPVTLIGEQTGGNPAGPTAGSIFFLTLPDSGLTLRLPVFRYENNSGDVVDGVGLTPDVNAPDTVLSLRAGDDPAMATALAIIRAKG